MIVGYSREAVGDLRRLREFIAVENPHAAQKTAATILKGIAQLKQFPLLGTKVDRAPNPEAVRDLVIGNYLARYLVHETEIYVLRIWHHREDRF
ncbi:Plasmid stabilization protein [Candidatus Nitrotoga sp. BS]|uniref:type II toxin-antitoxin system RelE/ParE family toxin n=1 Tax=Candidatus Nitrotoga sp. BS TaxID=2890408 RepID=UPI001EF2367C|nr:type II toxin-antitoxin system RelE/ParE family toxin [Candidatus Nitrotoga sp. BS]CAH1200046.1 Plasmid stabilization protein [Candidatus Nitrotoga sp. BS]